MRFCSLLVLALSIAKSGVGQTVIRAGRLLDVRTGASRTNVYIVLRDDRIEAVSSTPPNGSKIIDLSGQTVLPGLCDCHAHTVYDPKNESPTAYLTMSSAQAALWGARNVR